MSLFRSKIDPFCSLTIDLGPLYVERVFDSLLTRQGIKEVLRMDASERFELYLEYLSKKTARSTREQYTFIQFYKGHFYQQLANHSSSPENVPHWREKALCFYQGYLELYGGNDQSAYYAQWQIGMLQDRLKYAWPLAEESLSKASALDPLRGEACRKIIDYYFSHKDWERAYTYSSMALKSYFGKNPGALRSWFIDFNAYNWNIINAHLTICYKIGHLAEARNAYAQMLDYKLRHRDEFRSCDIRHIRFLEKIFYSNKRQPVST